MSAPPPTIVVVYVQAGLGPQIIASRLQQQLRQMGATCESYSLSTLTPAWLHQRLLGQYRANCLNNKDSLSPWHTQPWRFGLLYWLMKLPRLTPPPTALADLRNASSVIATSYLAAFFLARLRRQWRLNYKITGILGDYCTSPGWRVELETLCTPPTLLNSTLTWLSKRGVDLIASGIPVTPMSCPPSSDRLGHILVCGGGWGLGEAYAHIDRLLSHHTVKLVTAVCGDNRATLETLRTRHAPSILQGKLKLLGLVDDLSPLLAQAEAVITKPGGLTLSEAANQGTLLLLTPGITEHERRNAKHFLTHHAALDASTTESLESALHELSLPVPRVAPIMHNAKRLAGENALIAISQLIINKADNAHVDH